MISWLGLIISALGLMVSWLVLMISWLVLMVSWLVLMGTIPGGDLGRDFVTRRWFTRA